MENNSNGLCAECHYTQSWIHSIHLEFYKSKFQLSKNAKEFEKDFHGKGRELYQVKQSIGYPVIVSR